MSVSATSCRAVSHMLRQGGPRIAAPFKAAHRPCRCLHTSCMARKGLAELLRLSERDDGAGLKGRAPLAPGTVSPPRPVPPHIVRPPYVSRSGTPDWDSRPQIQDAEGLVRMRAACNLAARVLRLAGSLVAPGVTTDEIDAAVHEATIAAGAYPSPLSYGTFPKSVCTSVNECICHGIPDSRPLQEGDILNIDVTVYLDGYHGDTSAMFTVGEVAPEARALCEATHEALHAAIALCGPGVPFKALGGAIQAVADAHGFGVVRGFCGHGVGKVFHSYPTILHYKNREGGRMVPGMTFTIEPMLTQGSAKERYWKDGWTAVTTDGGLSAQYEHSLHITHEGVEILTQL
uniref:Methionine aminopeptidase n=2 Tax=Auxenochlorella protothecoides TaxID=3075 RepID=A0A1D2A5U4_AUXPR